ncbi:hypothetical protein ACFSUS_08415 [Spirosoma soli]|uniref:GNAT family N-acetyltransferase n=1 Tax=Spirosoma soli TaxID=1770529 RepID=A0ABW5M3E4_9BACT
MPIIVQPAQLHHRPFLIDLLANADLVTDDLPNELSSFVLAFDGNTLVGSAGFEQFGVSGCYVR